MIWFESTSKVVVDAITQKEEKKFFKKTKGKLCLTFFLN